MQTVEQRHRDAAWPFRPEGYGPADRSAWNEGRYDHIPIIQAFACLEAIIPSPAPADQVNAIAAEQADLEEYIEEYELCGDDGYYRPNEHERMLIADAMQGWLAERTVSFRQPATPGTVGAEIEAKDAFEASLPPSAPVDRDAFQARVAPWMQECFGAEISGDRIERGDRFLEEALELLQSGGYDRERVALLVDYVWGRPAGEPAQEVGGVMVTLAAYCLAFGLDMHEAAETELARILRPEIVAKIRLKQATKATAIGNSSPLPIAALALPPSGIAEMVRAETAWLIEFPESGDSFRNCVRVGPAIPRQYYGGSRRENGRWITHTEDHEEAIRFSRKEDAERVIGILDFAASRAQAVEHMWMPIRSLDLSNKGVG